MNKINPGYELENGYKDYVTNGGKYKYSVYSSIVRMFMQYMSNVLLEKGYVILPAKLGKLEIIGFKSKRKYKKDGTIKFNIDFNETRKLWEKDPQAKAERKYVYHFNENTNGYMYKIQWSMDKYIIGSKRMFKFKPMILFKRRLAKKLKEGKEYKLL